ncbi:MAG: hypothetical protein MSC31_10895 [Solirubrobacteraceae bacterium MAG38_C4-C5]|nr:hypothetical protein [Candidatus Siliceabacter maunaloa]
MSTTDRTEGTADRAALRRVRVDAERVERLTDQLEQARRDLAESELLAVEVGALAPQTHHGVAKPGARA